MYSNDDYLYTNIQVTLLSSYVYLFVCSYTFRSRIFHANEDITPSDDLVTGRNHLPLKRKEALSFTFNCCLFVCMLLYVPLENISPPADDLR